MKPFINSDFLLSTPTAKTLYHEYAASCPIVDYHCHLDPREIYEDRRFENITQAWLAGDHYKWRMMRANGVDENAITGTASDREKFQRFAETLSKAIGNPMFHWCHLELKRYFGYHGVLNQDTAEEVWQLTKEKLKEPDMGARGLIQKSKVAFIGTTDDPTDSLMWHKKIARDPTISTVVAPSFRPDKALNMDKAGWKDYLQRLGEVCHISIESLNDLKTALKSRMEYFHLAGCKASDHGLNHMVFCLADPKENETTFSMVLAGKPVDRRRIEALQTDLLLFCAKEYTRLGWVMQIHYNCLRNPNSKMFSRLGADAGFDCIGPDNGSEKLAKLLDTLNSTDSLPKTVLYSLDASDNAFLGSLIGSFSDDTTPGKLQHGSAWWFNDNKTGMAEQLTSLANLNLLGNFIGMLTDSRSFLSYTRHEYFRRILCNLIGDWVENGELPADLCWLGNTVTDICCKNALTYFQISK